MRRGAPHVCGISQKACAALATICAARRWQSWCAGARPGSAMCATDPPHLFVSRMVDQGLSAPLVHLCHSAAQRLLPLPLQGLCCTRCCCCAGGCWTTGRSSRCVLTPVKQQAVVAAAQAVAVEQQVPGMYQGLMRGKMQEGGGFANLGSATEQVNAHNSQAEWRSDDVWSVLADVVGRCRKEEMAHDCDFGHCVHQRVPLVCMRQRERSHEGSAPKCVSVFCPVCSRVLGSSHDANQFAHAVTVPRRSLSAPRWCRWHGDSRLVGRLHAQAPAAPHVRLKNHTYRQALGTGLHVCISGRRVSQSCGLAREARQATGRRHHLRPSCHAAWPFGLGIDTFTAVHARCTAITPCMHTYMHAHASMEASPRHDPLALPTTTLAPFKVMHLCSTTCTWIRHPYPPPLPRPSRSYAVAMPPSLVRGTPGRPIAPSAMLSPPRVQPPGRSKAVRLGVGKCVGRCRRLECKAQAAAAQATFPLEQPAAGKPPWQHFIDWWKLESPQSKQDASTRTPMGPLAKKLWQLCAPDKLLLTGASVFMVRPGR